MSNEALEKAIDALASVARTGDTVNERIAAIQSLGTYVPHPKTIETLASLVNTGDTHAERIAASRALAKK